MKTNFTAMSIILCTPDYDEYGLPIPIENIRMVKAEEIWPDYMIDWLNTKEKEKVK